MERIQELQPWLNGEYAVLLRTGTRLTLSRGQFNQRFHDLDPYFRVGLPIEWRGIMRLRVGDRRIIDGIGHAMSS